MVNECYIGINSTSEKNLEQREKIKKIWIGWPANGSRFRTKKQKRGLENDLDLLKKELWNENFAKKRKKTQKKELRQAPIMCMFR